MFVIMDILLRNRRENIHELHKILAYSCAHHRATRYTHVNGGGKLRFWRDSTFICWAV